MVFGCGDDTAEKALAETRRLVEDAGVDVLIGPLQIGESLVVREYARKRPETTFVDGTAAGQSLTLQHPARNFFRFSPDGAQFAAGLGTHAYRELGWRRAVTVASGEAFEYAQVAGFVAEFCALGGTIAKRIWSPENLAPYLFEDAADGFFVASPADFVFRGLPGNLSTTIVGGIFWGFPPPPLTKRWLGTVFGQPTAPTSGPAWTAYVSSFRNAFPALAQIAESGVFSIEYNDAVEATLQALERVDGDLSAGQQRFRAALATVELDSPVGRIRLDRNRQAIAPNFLSQWRKGPTGPVSRTIRVIPNVEQTFGGYFRQNGPMPSRTYPPCRKAKPPQWAQR
jgi:branched-chain amino acid transport system substrate-binding protein